MSIGDGSIWTWIAIGDGPFWQINKFNKVRNFFYCNR